MDTFVSMKYADYAREVRTHLSSFNGNIRLYRRGSKKFPPFSGSAPTMKWFPAKMLLVFCIALLLPNGFLYAGQQNNKPKQASVIAADFTFDVIPETFQLTVSKKGVQEQASNPLRRMQISDLIKTDSLVSWRYPRRHISVLIQKEKNYLDVTIKADTVTRFSWPKVDAESYMLPLWEGKYIPANDPFWQSFLKDQTYTFLESFSMGFFALNKPHYTLVYVVKNTFNNQVHFAADPAINFSFIHDFTAVNKEKTYGFRIYVTDTDPVAVSRIYKQYIVEKGRFKTLEEKAAENPNVRKLYGAPHIYFWTNGIITAKNMRWKNLQASWKVNESLFKWLVEVMKNCGDEDEATEFGEVLKECETGGDINDYQKKVIVRALNTALSFPELYNPKIFKYPGASPLPQSLSEQKLYAFNKKLLKGALKAAVDDPVAWGQDDVATLADMHRSGISRAWIGFPDWADGLMNPALVAKADKLGYLVGPYDSYNSIQQLQDRSWRSAWFPDSGLYDNATITDLSGKKIGGFLGRGRQFNPTLALPSVKQRVTGILSDHIPYNSWFVDCDAFGEVFDDYTPAHITTQEEDFNARVARMAYIGQKFKVVVGSEQGNDFASCAIAFAQGMEMPVFNWGDPDMRENKNSPYYLGDYWHQSGNIPSIYTKLVPLKPLYQHIYIDPAYSLPLYRLVYNNSVITTAHWESASLRIKNEVGTRMLAELLYNTPPLYHLDQSGWKQNKKLITNYLKVWSRLHLQAVKLPMTGFNVLSKDRMVQQTVFGGRIKVTVNFSDVDIKVGRHLIPSRSAIIDYGQQRKAYSVKGVLE